ncbi:MTERF5 [Symbiodinium necroappetens]|uniref:mTERF5 protein n=1 Tax=Symbiodinium necroappetens TaxID=1628268 RepID=A0A812IX15_9DINO|nr:MTERF5 [Symbiodinium necroappetens]
MLPARCSCGLSAVMRLPAHRKAWRTLACAYPRCLSSLSGCPSTVQSPPSWWQAGRARKRPGSLAEAELLSHLAVLLQPEEPIEELFRDFPVVRSDGWGRSALSPDLSVYGVLQAQEAALFLEYDGHYRHLMPPGMVADARKSKALLDFAPAGSYVLRIAHGHREWEPSCEMGEVVVDTWQPSREASLVKPLCQVVLFLLRQRGIAKQPRLEARLQTFVENPGRISRQAAVEFTEKVVLERECEFDPAPLHEFLQAQLSLSHSEGEELIRKCPALARYSIEHRLLPRMQFLESCGLTKAEVAKAIARYPPLLGMSIEDNLKPTVQWLRDLGLTNAEVSRVIALSPSRLGCSIEENLKPTVEWLRDLGLTKAEVAKVIARAPSVLRYSIEGNLKPTVQWLRDLGLTNAEVSRVIVLSPSRLGCSIEENLKPTVEWLRDLGLTKAEVAKVIARAPSVLGYSIEENLKPTVQWLRDLGLTNAEVSRVIVLSPSLLGCSIEENLKPTVEWLRDVRLTKAEVAKVIARYPSMLGFSIEKNLKPTVQWLRDVGLTKAEVAEVIARDPAILGYSIETLKMKVSWLLEQFSAEWVRRLLVRNPYVLNRGHQLWIQRSQVLRECGKLSVFGSAMMLTDAKFAQRYEGKVRCPVADAPSNDFQGSKALSGSAAQGHGLAGMRPPSNQKLRRGLLSGFPALFSRCSCRVVPSPPSWWKAGHPRRKPGSIAEAELLSHLAVLLRPDERIEELFRDFPAKQSEKWGRNTLSPDLAVYGALQAKEAALFVEYDGHYRHLMPPGMAADVRKSKALLDFAPAGSYVLRVAHGHREWAPSCEIGEVVIESWETGREASLVKALRQIVEFLLMRRGGELQPGLRTKLQDFMDNPAGTSPMAADEFMAQAAAKRERDVDPARLQEFLQLQLHMSSPQAEELVVKCPALARCNIDDKLKPMMQQLEKWGLKKSEVAKVLVRFPQIVRCSVEKNLKPAVQWLQGLGMTKADVSKVIARYPNALGLSIEKNLKPTVQWLRGLGLSKVEVVKVCARAPALLGYSIDENLKPTVHWFRELGLTETEVSKVIARCPQVMGCSIEENLKRKVQWFRDVGLAREHVATLIVRCPSVLGFSIENRLQPTRQWLQDLGLSNAEVAKVVSRLPAVLGLNIEKNLKPKVQWLRHLGLVEAEVANVMLVSPQLFALSLQRNLKPKLRWLSELFSAERVRFLLVRYPYIFGRSHERWARRIQVLQRRRELSSLGPAMMLTDAKFAMRFGNPRDTEGSFPVVSASVTSRITCGLETFEDTIESDLDMLYNRRAFACSLWGSLALVSCRACVVRSPPSWWKAGRPRRRPGSLAEAELLSHLAVLLLPEEPIAELFRDFPAEKGEGWGSNTLSPDLVLYGALETEEAALFLEYDGYYRHLTPAGKTADSRKTAVLLDSSPAGSYVLRIVHAHRGLELSRGMGEVVVDSWKPGHDPSLVKALLQVAEFLLTQREITMYPDRRAKLQSFVEDPAGSSRQAAVEFTEQVAGERERDFDPARLHEFLKMQLGVSISEAEALVERCPVLARYDIDDKLKPMMQQLEVWGLKTSQVAKVLVQFPTVLGCSIDQNLKPTVQWLRDLGLTKTEVAKVIARFPPVLGYSIEENLKPTVQWLRDVGLKKVEVAKVSARLPQVLGLSIEENLKPTVQWLRDLGLTKAEVAKVIARFPQVLGYSIEENLKPTVQWLRDLGLTKAEVAKVIARQPSILGLSIEDNLKPTVQWLRDVGLTKVEVAKVIARQPSILGLSIEENLKPTVQWLRDVGLTQAEVAKVIARFPAVLGYSIEENLKPTVQWLRDLGLTKAEVAKVISSLPQIFSRSLERNLKPKVCLLFEWFSSEKVRHLLVHNPYILNRSRERWVHRSEVLQACGKLSVFGSAMKLTEAEFAKRYEDRKFRFRLQYEGHREEATESLRMSFLRLPGIGPVFLQFVRSPQSSELVEGRASAAEEPIAELFRDFPAEKGEGWGSNTLSPDLALYGALESDESALFVEYDGYYRHQQPVGIAADSRKNTALLDLAPAGSYVLRIAHAHRGLEVSCQMGEVVVDSWQPGHDASLVKALLQVAEFLLTQREITMHPDRRAKLQNFVEDPAGSSGQAAFEFTEQVAAERKRDFDPARLHGFLQMQLGVSISEAEVLLAKCPALARYDIDDKLKPMMQQLEKWGLKTSQVAKVFVRFPQLLQLSIEENLKPTVQWLPDVGLTQAEVAKVIARSPRVLSLSIEENLKPTVQWLGDVGLTKAEAAKVIARSPQVLALSIEENLKPTVQWLRDVGLTKAEVTKVIARQPSILGYSIEENLKPTVQWLRDPGLTKAEVAKVVARSPQVLSLSIEENLKPTVRWLRNLGLTKAEVARVISLFAQTLLLSIEENLKPTVQWLQDLGLTNAEIAKVISRWPNIFGYSLESNLKPKVCLLLEWFSSEKVLQACGKLSVFGSAMLLTDAKFAKRYEAQGRASRPPTNQMLRRCLFSRFPALFHRGCCAEPSPPSWWKAGRPRRRPGSLAEAELLSHLAVLLLPEEPIAELFRDFPAERGEGWRRNTLSPDLAVYGALESEEAALFVEYDGYYRHLEPTGIAADSRKNTALLDVAPAGSYVLRIAHAHRGLELSCHMGEVVVDSWRPGHDPSLVKALLQVTEFLLNQRGTAMHPDRRAKLRNFVEDPVGSSRQAAVEFTEEVAAERERAFDPAPLHDILQMQLGASTSEAKELVAKCPALARCDIDDKLKPMMQELEAWGLQKSEVAKVIARFPQVLGYSIDDNLKLTVQWLRDLGLTKAALAKVIARHPQLLGLSIEGNLKPTVEWLRDLVLTKAEVAKVIARSPPVLGYSIEENLKPTVQWLRDLGLKEVEVSKVIARYPSVLGYSIEGNLKPTVEWFGEVGLARAQIVRMIVRYAQVLGLSIEKNLKPTVRWLLNLGLTKAEVVRGISLFAPILWLSIEENLKPTVQWLQDLGLTKAEIAKVTSSCPNIFGYSLERNLKPKVCLLLEWFSSEKVRHLLVHCPYILSRRRGCWDRRARVLKACDKLSVFGSAMMLTEAKFAKRYGDRLQDHVRSAGAKVAS